MLLRMIDDYLYITTNLANAKEFLELMKKGTVGQCFMSTYGLWFLSVRPPGIWMLHFPREDSHELWPWRWFHERRRSQSEEWGSCHAPCSLLIHVQPSRGVVILLACATYPLLSTIRDTMGMVSDNISLQFTLLICYRLEGYTHRWSGTAAWSGIRVQVNAVRGR